MRSRELRALATDYDRTLTLPGSALPVPRALDALARARDAGARIVVVSGRSLDFLVRTVGAVADAIVAENGAILFHQERARRLGPALDVRGALAELSIPLEHGEAIASANAEHEPLLRAAIARAGIDAAIIRNRDRIMVVPRGVDKALGAIAALEAIGIDPRQTAAAGDGENDRALLEAVGYGIAVANAVDEIKAIADRVTEREGGEGLADWIVDEWLPMREVRART